MTYSIHSLSRLKQICTPNHGHYGYSVNSKTGAVFHILNGEVFYLPHIPDFVQAPSPTTYSSAVDWIAILQKLDLIHE